MRSDFSLNNSEGLSRCVLIFSLNNTFPLTTIFSPLTGGCSEGRKARSVFFSLNNNITILQVYDCCHFAVGLRDVPQLFDCCMVHCSCIYVVVRFAF